jgi:hypothetical protein
MTRKLDNAIGWYMDGIRNGNQRAAVRNGPETPSGSRR